MQIVGFLVTAQIIETDVSKERWNKVKQNQKKNNKQTGPVVQNFVSLTLSLSPQFFNYISTSKANTLLFLVEKNVRILCTDSHIFSTKIMYL